MENTIRARVAAGSNQSAIFRRFSDGCHLIGEKRPCRLLGKARVSDQVPDRLKVFDKIMAKAKEYGIAPSRIHIDPLVEMLCTSENGIETNTEVISTVREAYPTIHITAAVSNISFNLPVRKMINLGFTVLAMNAGLDSAILDPTNRDMMGLIYATEALLGQDDYCMEYISAYREGKFGPVKQA